MKIYTDGARGNTCQLSRIEKGLVTLGHELTDSLNLADLIYSNNPNGNWQEIIRYKKEGGLKDGAKIIFNVLDIPEHLFPKFDLRGLTAQLNEADHVTTISKFVQKQVKEWCLLDSTVIYQPKMGVFSDKYATKHPYKYLFVGRALDPNKRTALGIRALEILGVPEKEVAYVGSEYPGFGDNLGVVTESYLHEIYNSVDFVFCLGKIEGICLPVVEAMACDAIPIIFNDLTTREELLPSVILPEYNENHVSGITLAYFISRFSDQHSLETKRLKSVLKFYYDQFLSTRFSTLGVARKILEIYENKNSSIE